jgi:XTP/dITP diphosphohydrolase
MKELVLASGNAGKLAELQTLCAGLPFALKRQSDFGIDDAEETGLSFVENALIKARHAAKQSGRTALADDSGLLVDALGGAPGLYTARYAGPNARAVDNISKLLDALCDVPDGQRGARFVAVIVVLRDALDPCPLIAIGEWRGEILRVPRGAGGFGYDPVFFDPELNASAAELGDAVKAERSHRGRALRALQAGLVELANAVDR